MKEVWKDIFYVDKRTNESRGRGQRKSHKGYKWYYLEDYLNMAILSEANTETVGTCND